MFYTCPMTQQSENLRWLQRFSRHHPRYFSKHLYDHNPSLKSKSPVQTLKFATSSGWLRCPTVGCLPTSVLTGKFLWWEVLSLQKLCDRLKCYSIRGIFSKERPLWNFNCNFLWYWYALKKNYTSSKCLQYQRSATCTHIASKVSLWDYFVN